MPRFFALLLVVSMTVAAAPRYIGNLTEGALTGPLSSTAALQDAFATHAALIHSAVSKIGLTENEWRELAYAVAADNLTWSTLPTRLDAMSGQYRGRAFIVRNIRIRSNVHGWRVNLNRAIVYIPQDCGNVSVVWLHPSATTHTKRSAAFAPAIPDSTTPTPAQPVDTPTPLMPQAQDASAPTPTPAPNKWKGARQWIIGLIAFGVVDYACNRWANRPVACFGHHVYLQPAARTKPTSQPTSPAKPTIPPATPTPPPAKPTPPPAKPTPVPTSVPTAKPTQAPTPVPTARPCGCPTPKPTPPPVSCSPTPSPSGKT